MKSSLDIIANYSFALGASLVAFVLSYLDKSDFWKEHHVIALLTGISIPLSLGTGLVLKHVKESGKVLMALCWGLVGALSATVAAIWLLFISSLHLGLGFVGGLIFFIVYVFYRTDLTSDEAMKRD